MKIPQSIKNLLEGHETLAKFVAAGAVLFLAIAVIGSIFSINNEGERRQETVEYTYQQSRNTLSECLDQGQVAAQVTEREFEAVRDTLTEIASARYRDGNQASNVAAAFREGGLITMLQEDHPEIDQRSWQNLQTLVVSCRGKFANSQDFVFVTIANFEQWAMTDNPLSYFVKRKFPTDELDVENLSTGEILTGEAALAYMNRIIEVEDARLAFERGLLEEQDLFGE